MKILVIEDDAELSKHIRLALEQENYVCETAATFATAIEKASAYQYDCIVLDITLPGGNGLAILKELKQSNRTDGILIISAKNSLEDKITGLGLGADDYLAKPFHLSELNARVAAIIRRKHFAGNSVIKIGDMAIDTMARTISVNDSEISFTAKEYDLLLYLVINKGRVVAKNAIAEHLWGDHMDMADSYDFIYTHIKNIRKKLGESGAGDYLQSVYGVGYKFIQP